MKRSGMPWPSKSFQSGAFLSCLLVPYTMSPMCHREGLLLPTKGIFFNAKDQSEGERKPRAGEGKEGKSGRVACTAQKTASTTSSARQASSLRPLPRASPVFGGVLADLRAD